MHKGWVVLKPPKSANVGGLDNKYEPVIARCFQSTWRRGKGLAKPLIGHELPAVDADMVGASCRKLAGSDEITQYHSWHFEARDLT